jgi:hypothetical protein
MVRTSILETAVQGDVIVKRMAVEVSTAINSS